MTLVLDAGGLSALAGQRGRLEELRRRAHWPAQVPAVVLTEALTGDHRRDVHVNRLLKACQVRAVDEQTSREAARLRTATGRAGTVSAVDAIVAAFAGARPDAIVLTSDPRDLEALAEYAALPITVAGV
ncbi:MAG: PIN domain-containing protein [Solirubrobacteraceae bacterium MAG38_C4-C5]|nr:PIN domain-containing protein [Candidatus Siliceabacter maunaloa]